MPFISLTINNIKNSSAIKEHVRNLLTAEKSNQIFEKHGISEFYCFTNGHSLDFFLYIESDEKIIESASNFCSEIAANESLHEKSTKRDADAIRYFLKKAIGLQDSEVVLNDLQEFRESFLFAREKKWVGPYLNRLYQRGVWLAEKVRIDLNLHKNAITQESVFLDLAKKIFGDLKKQTALVVSSNADCEKFIRKLKEREIGQLLFLNTGSGISNIAGQYGANKIEKEQFLDAMFGTDILLIFGNSLNGLFQEKSFSKIMQKRRNAPLLWLELPENITPVARSIDLSKYYNVYNYTREDLESIVVENLKDHKTTSSMVDSLIEQEIESFYEWVHSNDRYRFGEIIGKSESMQKVLEMVARISQTDISVLIDGESGTGKELIAKSIHQHSLRVNEPFIVVNCGAIPDTLLESELFGHVKGAFTGANQNKKGLFEAANKGTIFLDEIGETSPATQVKLLRFLQEGEVKPVGSNDTLSLDVRVITATNRNLEEMVEEGTFRQDLYYRLNVIQITIPSLRHRREDILPLIEFFMKKYSDLTHKAVHGFDDKAKDLMLKYAWPGNVRELENAVERAVALTPGAIITSDDLPPSVINAKPIGHCVKSTLNMTLKDLERQHIAALLKEHDWNYDLVTQILGIGRTTLWRKMKEYEIEN